MSQRKVGDYLILNTIGHGSQATVYRVLDSSSGDLRALKELHPHHAQDPYSLERFRREAALTSRVDSPHVIRVFQVGHSGNSHFLVMEYLPLSLRHILRAQGQLPVERAVDIALQVCQALEAAWERNIVHRDIKPSNILMTIEGLVKVADFGIARGTDLPSMTQFGAVMGTEQYMAPEQGQSLNVDIRSDLYSLGVLLYQMLSGRLPSGGLSVDGVLKRQLIGERLPTNAVVPEVTAAVAEILERLTANDPENRYQTPTEARLAIENLALPAPLTPIVPILGDYALLEEVGIGSQAVVYRAMDLRDSEDVALKVPHRHLVEKPSDIERVLREAEIVSHIHHPNLVEVLDQGDKEGQCFIAMEFMPMSLRSILNEEGMLDELECIRIARDVCAGLEEVDRHGLVHRDIKPENIMLSSDDRAKLADFGVALALANITSRTSTEGSPGTVRYMAPEQLRGDHADIQSDLYALGLVMFESLAGTHLLDARGNAATPAAEDVESLLRRHRPHASQEILLITKKALADDREERYQAPRVMLLDLEQALIAQAEAEAPTFVDSPKRRWPKTPKRVGVVAAIGFLLLVAGSGGLALLGGREPPPDPPYVDLLGFSTTTDGPEETVPAGGEIDACDPKVLVAWLSHSNFKPGETLNGEWFRNDRSRGAIERDVDEGRTLWFPRPDPNLPGEYRFDLNYQRGETKEILGTWDIEVKCTPFFELLGFSNTNDSSEGLVPEGGRLEVCDDNRLTVWVAHRDLIMDTALLGKWYRDGGTYRGDIPYEAQNPTDQMWFDLNPPTPPGVYRFELHYENGGLIGSWEVNVTC